MPLGHIPVISLAQTSADIARQLRTACSAHGFFYVADHGVPAALLAAQFDWAARFFALPDPAKNAVHHRNSKARRGYEGTGAQTLDAGARPDLKESFYCGVHYADDHPFVQAGLTAYGANQWPAELPGFREQCETYISAMLALSERLMRDIARSLDLPADYFDLAMQEPMATLRLLRYPPHPPGASADQFGAGAHTDWGAITILAQDDAGGLEVQEADGTWIAARPIPGTFVVNLGDMIPRWTNGLYRSNPHRVINRGSGRDRYSMPFFYDPNYHARIEPVPGTVAPGEAPLFTPCTAGEHLAEMYRKTYGLAA
jgi:isopenicillin N synthase-like dioxygenase